MMRKLSDPKPYLVDTGMIVKQVKWNPNGNVLAVCGSIQEGQDARGIIQFYSNKGQHLRSLRVPGSSGIVNSIAWEGFGHRIVLAIDSNVLFANIQPDYMWSYFNDTIVFAYRKPERNDMCITFWNTKINEKSIKYMKSLVHVKAYGDYCVLISKLHDPNQANDRWMIQLCNAIGCPVESKTIGVEPKYVAMNGTHVIVASEDVVYYWQYRSSHSKVQSLEQEKKKKSGKENAFHIEELPNPNGIYDVESW
jgi:WD repeat-containing protein 35